MADEVWKPDAASRARAAAELEAIDKAHAAVMFKCRLCGQLTARLDKYGLCSKTSVPHADWRQGIRTTT